MMSNSKTLSQRLSQHITSSFHDPIFGMKDSYAILAASSGRSSSSMSSSSRSTSSRSSAPPSPDSVTDAEDHPIGYGAFGVVWAVTDPRTKKRVALKKISNVYHSLVSCRRVYRELTMLCELKHDNIIMASDILLSNVDANELYVLTELMQSDLHKIITSPQHLSSEHIKLFVYQILRGLKYLHSANIIHRDIKPGNLLVNGDCKLKICDFGLARIHEPDELHRMTQEVVTQYYRPPEILMGAKHYTSAVDVWSVGCILAELLSRHVLFQANSAIQQLDLIVSVIGSPFIEDMAGMSEAAKIHVLQMPFQHPNLSILKNLSKDCTCEVVHLLVNLLTFNPRKRFSAEEALAHPYLQDGRVRYHTCMCSCCHFLPPYGMHSTFETEPSCSKPYSPMFEVDLNNTTTVRNKLHKLIKLVQERNHAIGITPLHLNLQSPVYKVFAESQCAQVNELPPSPYLWE